MAASIVAAFERVWWDKGCGAWKNLSVWRLRCPKGFISLGDIAVRGYDPPASAIALRDDQEGLLALPTGFQRIWKNEKGGEPGSIWYPVAPQGFVALGCVCSPTAEPPAVSSVRCVSANVVTGAPLGKMIWKDSSTFALKCACSLWKVENGIGTFLAMPSSSAPPEQDSCKLNVNLHVIVTPSASIASKLGALTGATTTTAKPSPARPNGPASQTSESRRREASDVEDPDSEAEQSPRLTPQLRRQTAPGTLETQLAEMLESAAQAPSGLLDDYMSSHTQNLKQRWTQYEKRLLESKMRLAAGGGADLTDGSSPANLRAREPSEESFPDATALAAQLTASLADVPGSTRDSAEVVGTDGTRGLDRTDAAVGVMQAVATIANSLKSLQQAMEAVQQQNTQLSADVRAINARRSMRRSVSAISNLGIAGQTGRHNGGGVHGLSMSAQRSSSHEPSVPSRHTELRPMKPSRLQLSLLAEDIMEAVRKAPEGTPVDIRRSLADLVAAIHAIGGPVDAPEMVRSFTIGRIVGEPLRSAVASINIYALSRVMKTVAQIIAGVLGDETPELKDTNDTSKPVDPRAELLLQFQSEARNREQDCEALWKIFEMQIDFGAIEFPDAMRQRMAAGGKSLDDFEKQSILTVRNLYTDKAMIFNKLRAKRPGGTVATDEDALQRFIEAMRGDACDFCNPLKYTAQEYWGRIQSVHCVTTANMAKYSGWHGLVCAHEHNPHRLSAEILQDMFQVSMEWFRRAAVADRTARRAATSLSGLSGGTPQSPVTDGNLSETSDTAPDTSSGVRLCRQIMWDILPRGGASQIHTHFQVSLTRGRWFASIEQMRSAAGRYAKDTRGRNFWSDLTSASDLLGLVIRHGDAVAVASLTPPVGYEFIFMAETVSADLTNLFYAVKRACFELAGMRAFSCGFAMPPEEGSDPLRMPVVGKIVDRGNPDDVRADISSNEIYGSAVISSDPCEIVRRITPRVRELLRQPRKDPPTGPTAE